MVLSILDDCDPPRPKRSKSFGELLGTNISDKVSSKYDTVSGSSRRQAKHERHIHTGFNLYSMNNGSWEEIVSGGTPEAIILSLQQEWYIQKLETEMDAFWREQAMDSEYISLSTVIISDRWKTSNIIREKTIWDLMETLHHQLIAVRVYLLKPIVCSNEMEHRAEFVPDPPWR